MFARIVLPPRLVLADFVAKVGGNRWMSFGDR
jgi:hypothetical protein